MLIGDEIDVFSPLAICLPHINYSQVHSVKSLNCSDSLRCFLPEFILVRSFGLRVYSSTQFWVAGVSHVTRSSLMGKVSVLNYV